jgi:hypothetical protein
MVHAFNESWLLYIYVLKSKAGFNQIFWAFKGFFSVPDGEGPDNLRNFANHGKPPEGKTPPTLSPPNLCITPNPSNPCQPNTLWAKTDDGDMNSEEGGSVGGGISP